MISSEYQLTEEIVREIQKHGIRARLRPLTSVDEDLGRISGSTIEVVTDPVETTVAAFTLCHLFGHMVQFTTLDRYKHLIDPVSQTPPVLLSAEFWREFYAYEREAFGYGAALLENVIPSNALRSRYANFMEVDFEHFREYITTGKRLNRIKYRDKVLQGYASHPRVVPIEPLSVSGVIWTKLEGVEATIY